MNILRKKIVNWSIVICLQFMPAHSYAADITLQRSRYGYPVVLLDGPIEKGDAHRFSDVMKKAIATPGTDRLVIALDSPGGDVREAIEIGRVVRATLAETWTSRKTVWPTESRERHAPWRASDPLDQYVYADREVALPELSKCWSACTIIFFSGVTRNATSNQDGRDLTAQYAIRYPTIGVHRPKFNGSEFGELAPEDARRAYLKMIESMATALTEMGAPHEFIERTMATSPEDIDLITGDEMERLYSPVEPFFEDWLVARCGSEEDVLDGHELDIYKRYRALLQRQMEEAMSGKDLPNGQDIALVEEFGLSGALEVRGVADKAAKHSYFVATCRDATVQTVRQKWAEEH